jgi:predicted dehydrogenase
MATGDVTVSRRGALLLGAGAVLAGAAGGVGSGALAWAGPAPAGGRGAGRLKVGVIGCGGRGTGAAANALEATADAEVWALGDLFDDRVQGCREELIKVDAARGTVPPERCFTGFDAFERVIASGVDVVVLASAPGFRPAHFAAAVAAGKHVFMEKPVAVDPVGVRRVMEAARLAAEKRLSVVAGTQRRHEACYREAMARIADGAIGRVVGASVYWNQGGLWNNGRRPGWSDVEWQVRNWLYFTWLSGDHIVEQHVHNLDVAAWALGEEPVSVAGMGGRQVRTGPEWGHVFDHFACEYEYAGGRRVWSYCRQIDGCTSRVEEVIHGTEGTARLAQFGTAELMGKTNWKWQGKQVNPYVQEHADLFASIAGTGPYVNHGERIAKSTMLAVAGRMAAYSGKTLAWGAAMASGLDLSPPELKLGPLPVAPVAVPGKTGVA